MAWSMSRVAHRAWPHAPAGASVETPAGLMRAPAGPFARSRSAPGLRPRQADSSAGSSAAAVLARIARMNERILYGVLRRGLVFGQCVARPSKSCLYFS